MLNRATAKHIPMRLFFVHFLIFLSKLSFLLVPIACGIFGRQPPRTCRSIKFLTSLTAIPGRTLSLSTFCDSYLAKNLSKFPSIVLLQGVGFTLLLPWPFSCRKHSLKFLSKALFILFSILFPDRFGIFVTIP